MGPRLCTSVLNTTSADVVKTLWNYFTPTYTENSVRTLGYEWVSEYGLMYHPTQYRSFRGRPLQVNETGKQADCNNSAIRTVYRFQREAKQIDLPFDADHTSCMECFFTCREITVTLITQRGLDSCMPRNVKLLHRNKNKWQPINNTAFVQFAVKFYLLHYTVSQSIKAHSLSKICAHNLRQNATNSDRFWLDILLWNVYSFRCHIILHLPLKLIVEMKSGKCMSLLSLWHVVKMTFMQFSICWEIIMQ